MIWQHVRFALLASSVLAGATTARAHECCSPAPDCCATRTICAKEWVPETYTTTRTVYKRECATETYTAYRCETVPETRTRTCTTYESVPEVKTVVRHVCVCVPTVEERTVMQKHWTCKPETKVVRKCVDKGHYECKEVPCGPSLKDRVHKLCHHKKDCCEDSCEPCCPVRTKTVKVWVACPTWEEHTVTCMKRVCECVPVTCKVTVMKHELCEEKCQVTCCKLVPKTHTETYTCNVTKLVPYQATRNVVRCIPHQETVTCTRMVCRTVQKEVSCASSCETSCCKTSCKTRCHHHRTCGASCSRHTCCE